eukprot:10189-Heterococcus_DN1.PRE.3
MHACIAAALSSELMCSAGESTNALPTARAVAARRASVLSECSHRMHCCCCCCCQLMRYLNSTRCVATAAVSVASIALLSWRLLDCCCHHVSCRWQAVLVAQPSFTVAATKRSCYCCYCCNVTTLAASL